MTRLSSAPVLKVIPSLPSEYTRPGSGFFLEGETNFVEQSIANVLEAAKKAEWIALLDGLASLREELLQICSDGLQDVANRLFTGSYWALLLAALPALVGSLRSHVARSAVDLSASVLALTLQFDLIGRNQHDLANLDMITEVFISLLNRVQSRQTNRTLKELTISRLDTFAASASILAFIDVVSHSLKIYKTTEPRMVMVLGALLDQALARICDPPDQALHLALTKLRLRLEQHSLDLSDAGQRPMAASSRIDAIVARLEDLVGAAPLINESPRGLMPCDLDSISPKRIPGRQGSVRPGRSASVMPRDSINSTTAPTTPRTSFNSYRLSAFSRRRTTIGAQQSEPDIPNSPQRKYTLDNPLPAHKRTFSHQYSQNNSSKLLTSSSTLRLKYSSEPNHLLTPMPMQHPEESNDPETPNRPGIRGPRRGTLANTRPSTGSTPSRSSPIASSQVDTPVGGSLIANTSLGTPTTVTRGGIEEVRSGLTPRRMGTGNLRGLRPVESSGSPRRCAIFDFRMGQHGTMEELIPSNATITNSSSPAPSAGRQRAISLLMKGREAFRDQSGLAAGTGIDRVARHLNKVPDADECLATTVSLVTGMDDANEGSDDAEFGIRFISTETTKATDEENGNDLFERNGEEEESQGDESKIMSVQYLGKETEVYVQPESMADSHEGGRMIHEHESSCWRSASPRSRSRTNDDENLEYAEFAEEWIISHIPQCLGEVYLALPSDQPEFVPISPR